MLTPRHSDTTPIPRNKPSIADLTVKAVTGRHGTDTSSFPPNKRNQSTKRNRASFPRSRDGLIGTSCRSSSYLFTDDQRSGRPEENYPFNATRFFFALRCPLTRRANYRPIPLGDRFPRFCRPSARTDTYETLGARYPGFCRPIHQFHRNIAVTSVIKWLWPDKFHRDFLPGRLD